MTRSMIDTLKLAVHRGLKLANSWEWFFFCAFVLGSFSWGNELREDTFDLGTEIGILLRLGCGVVCILGIYVQNVTLVPLKVNQTLRRMT